MDCIEKRKNYDEECRRISKNEVVNYPESMLY